MLLIKGKNNLSELKTIFQENDTIADRFMDMFSLLLDGRYLKTFDQLKVKGFSISDTLSTLVMLPFLGIRNIWSIYKSEIRDEVQCGKDVFYDLKTNPKVDWRKLLSMITRKMVRIINAKGVECKDAIKCLILDDTVFEKTGKHIENIGFVHDHNTNSWVLGLKMLCLGYWDGKSFIGLDFCFSKEKQKSKKQKVRKWLRKMQQGLFKKKRPNGTSGHKRNAETCVNKPTNGIEMIKRAIKNGFVADYVLVDSWFVSENFIKTIRSIKNSMLHVLGMCRMDKRKYEIAGGEYSAKALIAKYGHTKRICRKLKMQYIKLSVMYKDVPLTLFLVRQGYGEGNKWRLVVTTNTKLGFIKAMEIYQIRWTIEVYFRDCKQYLNFGKCQSNDFDAQIADTTISMIQHHLLTLLKRFGCYETIGGLFTESQQEIKKRLLSSRLWETFLKLIQALIEILGIDSYDIMQKISADHDNEHKVLIMLNALEQNRKAA
jgi:hypothetical protein